MASEVGVPQVISASGNAKSGQGQLLGFYVANTSSGTLQFYDDPATGTTTPMSGLITPAVGFNRFPAAFSKGLYVVVTGTISATLFYV